MSESVLRQASHRDDPAWISISNYGISFAPRLARENGWSAGYAARVVEEYRRFVYLAVTGDREVTPSDPVDQAWHLHLTYSRDYWERFCPEVLGKPLHHGPTAGGPDERHRHFAQYSETLKRYEAEFGPAPADIWPEAAKLLIDAGRMRRIDPHRYFLVPRRLALAAVAVAGAGLLAVVLSWLK